MIPKNYEKIWANKMPFQIQIEIRRLELITVSKDFCSKEDEKIHFLRQLIKDL